MPLAFPGEVLNLAARWTGRRAGEIRISLPPSEPA